MDSTGQLSGVKDYQKRLDVITAALFESSYKRVARGMLHDDRMVFGMLLCRIFLRGKRAGQTGLGGFEALEAGFQV